MFLLDQRLWCLLRLYYKHICTKGRNVLAEWYSIQGRCKLCYVEMTYFVKVICSPAELFEQNFERVMTKLHNHLSFVE